MGSSLKLFSRFFILCGFILISLVVALTYLSYSRNVSVEAKVHGDQYAHSYFELSIAVAQAHSLARSMLHEGLDVGSKADLLQRIEIIETHLRTLEQDNVLAANIGVALDDDITHFGMMRIDLDAIKEVLQLSALDPVVLENLLYEVTVTNVQRTEAIFVKSSAHSETFFARILDGAKFSMALNLVTVMLGVLGFSYFIYLNLINEGMRVDNEEALRKVEGASHAKSRLLSMLSHELRTPLNGVLGLVALGLQSPSSQSTKKLLAQIQSSAMDLNTFLGNILGFSNLDSAEEIGTKSIVVKRVFNANLKQKLAPISKRFDVKLEIHPSPDGERMFFMDSERVSQSLYHALSFILKNTFESRVVCETLIHEGRWCWKTDIKMSAEKGTKWQAEALAGLNENSDQFIESDSLETTMLHGLLESLGGQVKFIRSEQDEDTYRLILSFPIERSHGTPLKIVDFSEGQLLDGQINEILDGVAYVQLERSQINEADIVFIDTNVSNEFELTSIVRKISTTSQLIGVGNSTDPEQYDYHFDNFQMTSDFKRHIN